MGKPYRECPHCGAHLDAGEICDCRKKREETAAQPHEKMKLIAICREVDKATGRIAVYPLKNKIDGGTITALKIRAQMNPELRYFTLVSARWERFGEVIAGILKRRTVTAADVERIGGIVEL